MSDNAQKRTIWVLADDRAGNRSQALGIAEKSGLPFQIVEIEYGLLARLPNALLGASASGLNSGVRGRLVPPWPDLVISAGRRTAPVARWIKKQSRGNVRLVQVMDPGAGYRDFDLICRPAHDLGDRQANTLEIEAAPHPLTRAQLDTAVSELPETAASLAQPRIGLLVGGSTRRRSFTTSMAEDLVSQSLAAARAISGHVMATTSRRSGEAASVITDALRTSHFVYDWRTSGENPYRAILGDADAVIVTGESVSMCSEACITGKPVYIYAPRALITDKHARLHTNLVAGGYARMFDGEIDLSWTPRSLDVASTIVEEMKSRNIV